MKVIETLEVTEAIETVFKITNLEASNGNGVILANDAKLKLNIEKKQEDNPEEPYKISSDIYAISDNMVTYVLPNTTVTDFNKNITVNRTTKVINKSGEEQTGDQIVATGMKLMVEKENKEYTIVVLGDINEDGKVYIVDLAKLKLHLIEKEILSGINLLAADINKDGEVDIVDLARIKLILIDLEDFE